MLAAALIGTSITLVRMAGRDYGSAQRPGLAAVDSCTRHGPISNRGFCYWERCTATITWDDGTVTSLNADAVFSSADIGTDVRIGDAGQYRTSKKLAREDIPARPWLTWSGFVVGFPGVPPALLAVIIIRQLLRLRGRACCRATSRSSRTGRVRVPSAGFVLELNQASLDEPSDLDPWRADPGRTLFAIRCGRDLGSRCSNAFAI